MTKISQLGEFDLINLIAGKIAHGPGVVKGIGDDTAVLDLTLGSQLLVSSDMLVEGKHFLLEKITPFQLGYKALAVNLSDIAAMGGNPKFLLLSLGWPDYITVEFVQEFYEGVKALANKHNISIVGGDTVNAPQVVIDITILGEAPGKQFVSRNGALPGNLLGVTGKLGDAAAGLAWLLQETAVSAKPPAASLADMKCSIQYLVNRHLMPEPRIRAGQALLALGATAMIDISDGLASEVNHICRQSGVGARLEAGKIPLSPEIRELAQFFQVNPLEWALFGGEDYELLVAFPQEKQAIISKTLSEQGIPFTVIGMITEQSKKIVMIDESGQPMPLAAKGFNHFVK